MMVIKQMLIGHSHSLPTLSYTPPGTAQRTRGQKATNPTHLALPNAEGTPLLWGPRPTRGSGGSRGGGSRELSSWQTGSTGNRDVFNTRGWCPDGGRGAWAKGDPALHQLPVKSPGPGRAACCLAGRRQDGGAIAAALVGRSLVSYASSFVLPGGYSYLSHNSGPYAAAVGSITAAVSAGTGADKTHTRRQLWASPTGTSLLLLRVCRAPTSAGLMHANPATKQQWGHYKTVTMACGCCHSCCSGQLLQHRRRTMLCTCTGRPCTCGQLGG